MAVARPLTRSLAGPIRFHRVSDTVCTSSAQIMICREGSAGRGASDWRRRDAAPASTGHAAGARRVRPCWTVTTVTTHCHCGSEAQPAWAGWPRHGAASAVPSRLDLDQLEGRTGAAADDGPPSESDSRLRPLACKFKFTCGRRPTSDAPPRPLGRHPVRTTSLRPGPVRAIQRTTELQNKILAIDSSFVIPLEKAILASI